ncbi:MAG TPA: phosphoenolpyruvate--protein phosphotransferase [Spirochaetia bacterium]|nr:phosphoenolpyruvate--protein phosphotransferase [Spirochaetia bacterium]
MKDRKENIDLVCSVAELASLFEKPTGIQGFLQNVVELVSDHMHSDVCSIYLYEREEQELVLRATKGLHPDSIGNVRLKIGEGITGLALRELRPILEPRASDSPFFKRIPDINEEQYEAFLAVPIRRGLTRIGVITLQHHRVDYFDAQDSKALRAIASQLAATLENVGLLIELRAGPEKVFPPPDTEPGSVIGGMVAAGGIAIGSITVLGQGPDRLAQQWRPEATPPASSGEGKSGESLLRDAIERTEEQLETLQREMEEDLADIATLIFNAHLLMLRDDEFAGRMIELASEGETPWSAVRSVVERFVGIFSQSKNERIQEKVQDIQDLGHRILLNLDGGADVHADYEGAIVVTARLFPSELVRLVAQSAEGIVVSGGGNPTSHISILARSLAIPVIFVSDDRVMHTPEGVMAILDCELGRLMLSADREIADLYRSKIAERTRIETSVEDVPAKCRTTDDVAVRVLANVNLLQDARLGNRNKAEGIGLYRSEFPFIVRDDFPSEEEQVSTYRRIIEAIGDREVTLRTLDIGGDKMLRFLPDAREENPFLGLRGIRFCLSNREIFADQLRAMLRAGVGADLKIMFPMVSSLDEFLEAREILNSCADELTRDGVEHNCAPQVGAMVELPSAVECAPELAAASDFLCIGSNDLIMYMLAVDRTNEHVGSMYQSYHPSVLRAIKRVVDSIGDKVDALSICGDAAADPLLLPFFLGIGIRRVSVEPKQIPQTKRFVQGLLMDQAAAYAHELLSRPRLKDVQAFLAESVPG